MGLTRLGNKKRAGFYPGPSLRASHYLIGLPERYPFANHLPLPGQPPRAFSLLPGSYPVWSG